MRDSFKLECYQYASHRNYLANWKHIKHDLLPWLSKYISSVWNYDLLRNQCPHRIVFGRHEGCRTALLHMFHFHQKKTTAALPLLRCINNNLVNLINLKIESVVFSWGSWCMKMAELSGNIRFLLSPTGLLRKSVGNVRQIWLEFAWTLNRILRLARFHFVWAQKKHSNGDISWENSEFSPDGINPGENQIGSHWKIVIP